MVKSGRPVIVLSPRLRGRSSLVTVVALSTVAPDPPQAYHLKLPRATLPQLGNFQTKDTWLKGDMVYSAGFHRLDLIQLGKRDPNTHKRLYFQNKLSRERMREVYGCVLCALNLETLVPHL